jgi:hypothetical protein
MPDGLATKIMVEATLDLGFDRLAGCMPLNSRFHKARSVNNLLYKEQVE